MNSGTSQHMNTYSSEEGVLLRCKGWIPRRDQCFTLFTGRNSTFRSKTVLCIFYILLISIIYHFDIHIFYLLKFYLQLFSFLRQSTTNLCFTLGLPTMTWGVSCWMIRLLKLSFARLVLRTSVHLWHPGTEVWSTDLFALVNRRMRQLCTAYKTVAITYIMRGKNRHLPKCERPDKGKNKLLINQLDWKIWLFKMTRFVGCRNPDNYSC